MALAVLACLGSLLGWQFTIAQTGKSAADERMFPAFFSKVNRMGAPITGMIVLGVVQTLLALLTISPTLSEQFSALVNLAVVTNVIPYIIALSALFVMMKTAQRARRQVYTRNVGDRDGRDALQRVRALRLRQGRRHGRHAGDGHRLHHLGLHRAALHTREPQSASRGKRLTVTREIAKENNHAERSEPIRGMRLRRAPSRVAALRRVAAPPAAAQTLDRIKDSRPHQARLSAPTRGRSPSRATRAPPRATRSTLCQQVADAASRRELGLAGPDGRVGAGARSTTACATVQQGDDRPAVRADQRDAGAGDRTSRSRFRSSRAASARCCARTRPRALRDALSRQRQPDKPVWRGSPAARCCRSTNVRRRRRHDARRSWLEGRRTSSAGRRDDRAGSRTIAPGCSSCWTARSTCSSASASLVLARHATTRRATNLAVLDRLFTHEPAGARARDGRRRLPRCWSIAR